MNILLLYLGKKAFCFRKKRTNNSMEEDIFSVSLDIFTSTLKCVINGYYVYFSAWAMVDGGSNVKARTSYNEKTPRIVVSRSHSGMVKQVALQTFGNQTTIIPAGGAGMFLLPCHACEVFPACQGLSQETDLVVPMPGKTVRMDSVLLRQACLLHAYL